MSHAAVSHAAELAARVAELEAAGEGDATGLALVRTLLERAQDLPPAGRVRLIERARALLATYRARVTTLPPERRIPSDDGWRAALAARAQRRTPRAPASEARSNELFAEIRASAATARAADRVPETAGPYNGAAVASRALDELYAISPAWVGSYVAWLEDLGSLGDLPERRGAKKKI